jgi:hypothetical protein
MAGNRRPITDAHAGVNGRRLKSNAIPPGDFQNFQD